MGYTIDRTGELGKGNASELTAQRLRDRGIQIDQVVLVDDKSFSFMIVHAGRLAWCCKNSDLVKARVRISSSTMGKLCGFWLGIVSG